MEMHDKEFEKLVKKARTKKLWHTVVATLLILALLVGVGGGIYQYHYNLGFFSKNKIAGVPNHSIKKTTAEETFIRLLMPHYGGYEFNYTGKKVTVYFDCYQYDQRVSSEIVAKLEAAEETMWAGSFYWGMLSEDLGDWLPEKIQVQLLASGSLTAQTYSVPLLPEAGSEKSVYQATEIFPLEFRDKDISKIQKNTEYVFQIWQANTTGTYFSTATFENFKEISLKETEESYILYAVFQ